MGQQGPESLRVVPRDVGGPGEGAEPRRGGDGKVPSSSAVQYWRAARGPQPAPGKDRQDRQTGLG